MPSLPPPEQDAASGEQTMSRNVVAGMVIGLFLGIATLLCLYLFVIRKRGWLCTARPSSTPSSPSSSTRLRPAAMRRGGPVASLPFDVAAAKARSKAKAKANASADTDADYVPPYSRDGAHTPPPPYPLPIAVPIPFPTEPAARCPSYLSAAELGHAPAAFAFASVPAPAPPAAPAPAPVARPYPVRPSSVYVPRGGRVLPVAAIPRDRARATAPSSFAFAQN